jgi:hypothetical protein
MDYAMSHANDDRSPLIDLLTCIGCEVTMKIEKSAPDENGRDLIQYRCELRGRIELVRLIRRSRDAA